MNQPFVSNTVSTPSSLLRIAFLGGGNMAQAILFGLQSAEHSIEGCAVWERDTSKHAHLQECFGVPVESQFEARIQTYDVWLLAVKPNDILGLCDSLRGFYQEMLAHERAPLIMSIAAGIPIQAIAQALEDDAHIIRVMPNTPATIGQAMSGAYCSPSCTSDDSMKANTILKAIGEVVFLDNEEAINAITAISGSGVAYFYYFAECLQQAAKALGLSTDVARLITQQTFQGGALMAGQTDHDLKTLRQQVTSKGGTTEQALACLKGGLPQIVQQAVEAALVRAKEIEQSFSVEKKKV